MGTVEERVTVLETDVAQIRQEWAVVQQAPLIQARLLNALRETQLEQGQAIGMLKADVGTLKADVAVLKADSVEFRQGFADLRAGQEAILGILNHLVDQEERR